MLRPQAQGSGCQELPVPSRLLRSPEAVVVSNRRPRYQMVERIGLVCWLEGSQTKRVCGLGAVGEETEREPQGKTERARRRRS